VTGFQRLGPSGQQVGNNHPHRLLSVDCFTGIYDGVYLSKVYEIAESIFDLRSRMADPKLFSQSHMQLYESVKSENLRVAQEPRPFQTRGRKQGIPTRCRRLIVRKPHTITHINLLSMGWPNRSYPTAASNHSPLPPKSGYTSQEYPSTRAPFQQTITTPCPPSSYSNPRRTARATPGSGPRSQPPSSLRSASRCGRAPLYQCRRRSLGWTG
jgi:hypothetical protein